MLKNEPEERIIVALTDGIDNSSYDTDMKFINKAKKYNCPVNTIAFGEAYTFFIQDGEIKFAKARDDDILENIADKTYGDFSLSIIDDSSNLIIRCFLKPRGPPL